jgi:lipopolysaccharide export system protein LptC
MLRGLLYYGALLIMAGASLWLLFSIRASLEPATDRTARGPSLYLDEFSAVRFDAEGVRQYTLSSPHLVQLPDERGIEVEQPRLEVFRDAITRDWLLEAEQGWLSADQSLIVLRQTVDAYRTATENQPPMTLHTRDLIYRPRENLLSSDAEVRLETPNGWLQGLGMRADLDQHRMQLLWNVRGEYAPPVH